MSKKTQLPPTETLGPPKDAGQPDPDALARAEKDAARGAPKKEE